MLRISIFIFLFTIITIILSGSTIFLTTPGYPLAYAQRNTSLALIFEYAS
jgi:hypothetical protein